MCTSGDSPCGGAVWWEPNRTCRVQCRVRGDSDNRKWQGKLTVGDGSYKHRQGIMLGPTCEARFELGV